MIYRQKISDGIEFWLFSTEDEMLTHEEIKPPHVSHVKIGVFKFKTRADWNRFWAIASMLKGGKKWK